MTTKGKRSKVSASELTEAVREMGESLHRLVAIGEAALGTLRVSATASNFKPEGKRSRGTASCSEQSMSRSENITPPGLIDLKSEEVITFRDATALVPTRPPVSVSTISRWCTTGCRGIKLESVFVGGRRKTTRQALERFLMACRERGWAGMHGNTADALERALVEKGYIVAR